jgi:hypothetical protein
MLDLSGSSRHSKQNGDRSAEALRHPNQSFSASG